MIPTVFLMALAAGDAAPAGAEYTRGLALLQEKKYEEAAAAFEGALRYQPAETLSLKYRDENGRHRHAYHPHYQLGLTRLAQAGAETSLYVRRERLQAAARSFNQSDHPDALARSEEVASALEATEKLIEEMEANTPPPEIGQLRAKVDRLCEEQKYEEALREIQAPSDLFRRFERIRNEMLANVRNRQRSTLASFDVILGSRLDSISRTDPTYEAEIVLPLLKPARVPPEVTKNPAPRFGWLDEFYALYGKELERVRTANLLPPDKLLPSAAAFDGAAARALEIGLFSGFRAARNMGHSMRMARLREMAALAEKPDSDLPGSEEFKKDAAELLAASDESQAAVEKELRGRLERAGGTDEDLRKYLETDLPYQKRQIEAVRGKIRELTVAYDRKVKAEEAARKAEAELYSPEAIADPAACRKIAQPLSLLEAQAYFETLPAPVRARVLFARAVSEAFATFLEAEPPARAIERCRADVQKACALNPRIDAPWKEKGLLSPRILALFDEIRKQ